jgi:cobalt-zinc-cadmium efflux system protein
MPHAHEHEHDLRPAQQSALRIALVANGVLLGAEVVGGLAFHSLALLGDAAHMATDVVALTIALVAHRLLERPASQRHTFGLQRAEVLAAQASGTILLVAAAWLLFSSLQRLNDPVDVRGGGLLVVATLGLLVNVFSAFLLARSRGSSLNMRAAYLHMTLDAAGSVGALVAGVLVLGYGIDRADPIVSIAISALLAWSAWRLLKDTTHVLLEGTPQGMVPLEIETAMAEVPGVEAVHHLHLWNLASDTPVLSAHVVLEGELSLHEAQEKGDQVRGMLDERFGIGHATLELECHPCEPEPRTSPQPDNKEERVI